MADLQITGTAQVIARLNQLTDRVPDQVERALREVLETESLESQRRTPVKTGALKASHRVSTDRRGRDVSGTITVGGVSASYAIPVHENLEAFHKVGQAKFLESTIDEARPHLLRRIADRVRL